MEDQLDSFIKEIIDQKEFPGLTPEVKVQLSADLREKLIDQINRNLIAAMQDEKVEEFDHLIDSGADDVALQRFIADSGVNVPQVTLATMVAFRNLYLGDKA